MDKYNKKWVYNQIIQYTKRCTCRFIEHLALETKIRASEPRAQPQTDTAIESGEIVSGGSPILLQPTSLQGDSGRFGFRSDVSGCEEAAQIVVFHKLSGVWSGGPKQQ